MAAKKRKRLIWVTLTMIVLASAAVVSVKALGGKPAKIDPEKLAKVERIDLARSVVATGKVQPVTQVANAMRDLLSGAPAGAPAWHAVLWCLGIMVGSIALAGALFRRRTR